MATTPNSQRRQSFQVSWTPDRDSIHEQRSVHSENVHGTVDSEESSETWGRHVVVSLHNRILSNLWFDPSNSASLYTPNSHSPTSNYDRSQYQGVLLRQSRGVYITQPVALAPDLVATVQRLNVQVAFTMTTELTSLIFSILAPNQTELVLPHDSTQYQILESFEEMSKATSNKVKRFQYTCFVRKERMLLLWHDDVEQILVHAANIEAQLSVV